jgi:tetratricopeptide (TPR) repeat protein
MSSSTPSLSTEEQEQILQTIEMFEVIVQANPQDCQSLEILKDAYQRVGKQQEMLAIGRKLAETHMSLGQYSAALLEYEGILQHDPDNPEIIAALGEVDEKLQKSGQSRPQLTASSIDLDFRAAVAETGTLMTTSNTHRPDHLRTGSTTAADVDLEQIEDGNAPLAKFLIQHRLVSEEAVELSLERVTKKNKELPPNGVALSLIDEIVRRGACEMDMLLCNIIDRSKFAYIPLDYYDVDRQVVRMLPDSLTLGRLIVPFDVISRTVMIATANPFDAGAKEAVQQLLDYNIQWHLASPTAILKVLGETYRITNGVAAPSAADAAAFKLAS